MTRGEKIAWIWVWFALTVVSLTAVFLVWRFWGLPYLYFKANICGW